MAWSETDSDLFIDEGNYFVPEREQQIEIICDLVAPPDGPPDTAFHIIDLCCGEGLLTRALLERFPAARLLALDGSPKMLASTIEKAGPSRSRLEARRFDLAANDWRSPGLQVHAVVSSLAVHHLNGEEKRALFRDLAAMILSGGVFVLADLVAPVRAPGVGIAARSWDEAVRQRALRLDGTLDAFDRFRQQNWNFYADPDPDPMDQPSTLLEQMKWLEAAGFESVDLHWMKAGHAILSAAKP